MKKHVSVMLACGLLFSDSFGQSLSDTLSARLRNILARYSLAGISVVATKGNSIVAVGGAGWSDIARALPVTDSTMYRVASISKTVTATALMQLYEEGRFSLDDDVEPFLSFPFRNPSFSDIPITIRMLLSHTSSVRDGSGYNAFLGATGGQNPPPPISSVLVPGGAYYTAGIWSAHRPGTFFEYTNLGFGIVGTLVEVLSGERFDQYCQNHIFRPLGLEASFNVNDLRNLNNLAVLYRASGGKWVAQADNYGGVRPQPRDYSAYVPGSNGSLFGPQGNMRISAKDLARFMSARMNGGIVDGVRILRDSTARRMHTPQWTYDGSNGDTYGGLFRRWGLGTHITTNAPMGDIVVPGKFMAGHPGEAYGLISDAYGELGTYEFGIIFMTNGRDGSYPFGVSSAFYDVEETIFAETYALLAALPTAVRDANPGPEGFVLDQNFPNPFNPATVIRFSIKNPGFAILKVYDVLGREVSVLVNEHKAPGRYEVRWDASGFPSGVYFSALSVFAPDFPQLEPGQREQHPLSRRDALGGRKLLAQTKMMLLLR